MNYILQYWGEIEAGNVAVSKRVKRQYAKIVDDIANPKGGYIFSEARAMRPIEFVEKFCKHSKGEWAGRFVELELFQKAFISALFGFVHEDTGLRRYKEALFYVARKNGKSTLLAGIALYMLISDGEMGAEVYSAATKKDQAQIIFTETHNMIRQNPALAKHLKKRKVDLYFPLTLSKFQPLGRDSDTLDGLNANCIIMDELHGIKDRNMYEVLKQSQSARRQPILVMITTAGTLRECIFDDMYAYACNVVDGVFEDNRFLPILYELDGREEWTNPNAWQKANPALGTIKKHEDLLEKVQRAQNNVRDLSGVLVKDFNIRESRSTAWLSFDDIVNLETFDIEQFKGSYAIGGADLSRTRDLTCATLLLFEKGTLKRHVTQMYWLPSDNFEQRIKQEKVPYDTWLDRGLLRLCDGNTINYTDVTDWFLEMANKYQIMPLWLYYDNWSATYWTEQMKAHGFNMVACIQGAKTLSLPMQSLGADLQKKKINYNNNPLLAWCLGNTAVKTDRNGNIVPIKNQTERQRIDGTASLLNAYVGLHEHYNEVMSLFQGVV